MLSKADLEAFQFVKSRIEDLKEARKDVFGVDIEKVWAEADRDYVPQRLKTKGKRVIATDEEKGWRGTLVTLGTSDWQSDIMFPNPYVKIQTALSILIDQNPTGVFTAASKKYQATTELIKQLYSRSWEYAKSKQQLKLFVFNLAKYGWAVARTYPLKISRKVKQIIEFNPENPEKSIYQDKEVVEYNDVFRENLDPFNSWIDDMARPNNSLSIRDWAWKKVYAYDAATEEFGAYPNWKYVTPRKVSEEKKQAAPVKQYREKEQVEVYFYENRIRDLFLVIANEIPIIISPLPISDATGNKKLSLWQGYWNLRHAESPYGVGIYEAIRYDDRLLNRVRNMTIDQLTLSIYKMFFYQGTQSLTETGDITIKPGTGKQVLNPKDVNWLEVPGPGKEAWEGLEMFKNDIQEASGITDTLVGEITGKTAFEIAQAKESALKRLKTPLENILDALTQEGYITVSLIQLLYSIPETYKISDPNLIDAYLKEIQSDPDLYERDENDEFVARVYPEFPLNLDKDEKGNLVETQDTRFFRVKPQSLQWEGMLSIKPQSILTPSKQVDKALELEMYNMLIPLLGLPPEAYGKVAKNIVKLYDKDPKDVLPDFWLQEQPITPISEEPLIVPQAQVGQPQAPEAQRFVSSPTQPQNPQGLIGKIVSKLSSPFRRV